MVVWVDVGDVACREGVPVVWSGALMVCDGVSLSLRRFWRMVREGLGRRRAVLQEVMWKDGTLWCVVRSERAVWCVLRSRDAGGRGFRFLVVESRLRQLLELPGHGG